MVEGVTRRLRVLAEHPRLGKPNDVRDEFEDAQAYVDNGYAEWITPERTTPVEATVAEGAPETTVARPSARRTPKERTAESSEGSTSRRREAK